MLFTANYYLLGDSLQSIYVRYLTNGYINSVTDIFISSPSFHKIKISWAN
ncbi:hypothetical protein AB07_4725 [Citrobacter freundii]|nr:hypothetical protein AB07_4725 [Citrobacter freundii]CAD5356928.1 protein of unknown function [Citrobacter freundii]